MPWPFSHAATWAPSESALSFVNPPPGKDRAHGHEAAGERLGQHNDVRVQLPVVLDGEEAPGAAHARLHFVIHK